MKLALLVTLALASAAAVAAVGSNYAVLVAGSNGYYNYRHQADVCHAFHVLTEKGNIPKENIIVMMYDDIASSPSNPVPGTLINHPNGTDVYKGVNKDYTGDDVTPENFLAVLSGNSSGVNGGSGRVLNSGPEDNVFVYFSDHGATGLVAFPSTYLYANDLISTLKTMHANKKYKELVFYLEACESGSMFDSILPENINIYATTASSPTESSYACYYDASRGTYLGDEYSVRWMEDADTNDKKGSSWTLKQQFVLVQNQTLQSGVHQYGNLKQQGEKIREFEGNDNTLGKRMVPHRRYPLLEFTPCGSAADSRDVKIKTLLQQRAAVQDENGLKAVELDDMIAQELHHRAMSDLMVDSILMTVSGNAREKEALKSTRRRPSDFECLKSSVEAIEASCGKFSDYSLKYVYTVVNMCESGYGADFIAEAARQVCEKLQF